jgi:hypothetical protein
MTALGDRITRLYYTRMHGGTGELQRGHTPREAMTVLANRQTDVAGACK